MNQVGNERTGNAYEPFTLAQVSDACGIFPRIRSGEGICKLLTFPASCEKMFLGVIVLGSAKV